MSAISALGTDKAAGGKCSQPLALGCFGLRPVCDNQEVDFCYENQGKESDTHVVPDSQDMNGIWMRDIPVNTALAGGRLKPIGSSAVGKRFKKWFPLSTAAVVPGPGTPV